MAIEVVWAKVLAIVLHRVRQLNRTDNVEGKLELSVALRIEIIVDRTAEAVLMEVFLVGHALEEIPVVGFAKLQVAVVDQDDDALLLTCVVTEMADRSLAGCAGYTASIRLCPVCLSPLPHLLQRHLLIIGGIGLFLEGATIGRKPIVAVLIANQTSLNGGAIGKGDGFHLSGAGRNGDSRHRYQKQHEAEKTLFHIKTHFISIRSFSYLRYRYPLLLTNAVLE